MAFLFFLFCLAALRAAPRPASPGGRGAPRIRVSPTVLDFGRLGTNETRTTTLTIRNEGESPLHLTKVHAACDCTKWKYRRGTSTIPPGGATLLDVTLSTGYINAPLHKWIDLECDDPLTSKMKVGVLAQIHPETVAEPFSISPLVAAFQRPLEAEFKLRARKGYRGEIALEELRSTSAHVTVAKFPLEAKEAGYRIRVTVEATHPEGRFRAEIQGKLNGYRWIYRVHGEVYRGIIPEPQNFSFQRVRVPEDEPSVVTLRSADGLPFEVISIRSEPDSLHFTRERSDDSLEHKLTARLYPTVEGRNFHGDVFIQTTHPEKPMLKLRFFGFFDTKK